MLYITPNTVFAEEKAQRASGGLEEVTVTARKVSENLQDTPIAITALGGDALAESGINNVSDLTKAVPGLDIGNKGEGNAAPYIRGVGQRQNKATLDPAVAIYMDDVYLGRPDGALMDLADIQSLQVLRGPQGTLFGRNATGGAIIISPKKPTDQVEGMFLARTGSYNRQDIQFAVNTPISDNVFTRLAAGQTKRDGYSENLTTGTEHDNENRKFALGQLRWLVGDYTTVDIALNYSKQNENARSQHCIVNPNITDVNDPVQVVTNSGPLGLAGFFFGNNHAAACKKNQDLISQDKDKFYASLDGKYKTEAKGATLSIEHEFENVDFKSVTSYRHVEVEQSLELDGTDLPLLDQDNLGNPHKTDQFTQEFQWSGSLLDGFVDYTTGLYYWQESNQDGIEQTITGPMTLFGLPGIGVYRYDYLERETDNKSFSAYGQLNFNLSDHWSTTLGLRYTTETRQLEAQRLDARGNLLFLNGGQIIPGAYIFFPAFGDPDTWIISPFEQVADGGFPMLRNKAEEDFNAITPMFNITHYFHDSWLDFLDADSGMVYFTVSKGFRAGGLVTENTTWVPNERTPDPFDGAHFSTITSYDPEEVINYEIGSKLDLFGKLRLNTALYYLDYTDKQETLVNQNVNNPLQVQAELSNAGHVVIKGFELEATYLATENLDFTLNLNLTDAEYKDFESTSYPRCIPFLDQGEPPCGLAGIREVPVNRKDEEVAVITPVKVFLAAQYRLYTPWAMITPRIEANYSGGNYQHFDRGSWEATEKTGAWEQDSYTIWNARLNVDLFNEQTRFAFAVNNITDKRPIVGGKPLLDTLSGGSVAFGPPRMWTAEFIHKF